MSLAQGTPGRLPGDDNVGVETVQDLGGGFAWRRLTSAEHLWVAGMGVLGLAAVIETIAGRTGAGVFGRIVLLCLLDLAGTLPLALPRPTVTAATTTATTVAAAGLLSLAAFATLTATGGVAQVLAGYQLGRRGLPGVAGIAGAGYLLIALTAEGHSNTRTVGALLACGLPAMALAGAGRRMRREDAEREAAEREVAGTLLEHSARTQRASIARELHDVVAHHISMVAVQAESARLTTPGMPALGAQRLIAIGDTARAALTEMRRLLGVLREDAPTDPVEREPQPGLGQLTDLLDEARDATGAGVRLILQGYPAALDPGVELAAYRIVQEALTNARRHAPGAAVDVELRYLGASLRLRVRDNGPGPAVPRPADGHGLLGMRERAAAVGGRLRAGPASSGGFLVDAWLPMRSEDRR